MSIFYERLMKEMNEAEEKVKNMSWEETFYSLLQYNLATSGVYAEALSSYIKKMSSDELDKLIDLIKQGENWEIIDYIHEALDSVGYNTELVSNLYHQPHYLLKGYTYDDSGEIATIKKIDE